jgi:hypothetical protein
VQAQTTTVKAVDLLGTWDDGESVLTFLPGGIVNCFVKGNKIEGQYSIANGVFTTKFPKPNIENRMKITAFDGKSLKYQYVQVIQDGQVFDLQNTSTMIRRKDSGTDVAAQQTAVLAAGYERRLAAQRAAGPPEQHPAESDESYAWRLVMHHVNAMWDGVFAGKTCVGSRLTGIPTVTLEQIQGFKPNVHTELIQLSSPDTLNGIRFRARFYFSVQAARYYDRGAWTQWIGNIEDMMPSMDGQPRFGIFVEKRSQVSSANWTATIFNTNMMMTRTASPCDSMPK